MNIYPDSLYRKKRFLVVNVNWLGDCVLTLPIFKAIRNKFPQSYIGVMVVGRLKELFQNNPYIDKVMVFDEKTTHKNLFSKLRFIKMLRKEKFEVFSFRGDRYPCKRKTGNSFCR
ncbi:MAG: hypothetical protein B6D56_05995 [Candidatus Omnitrophica bacterium 4484_70.1]|nr:MAG: hypothetical protein B6D56_05995 [Candidatus Omnitrophica bacterium 4484_70.1]